jgi:hypothetical protein
MATFAATARAATRLRPPREHVVCSETPARVRPREVARENVERPYQNRQSGDKLVVGGYRRGGGPFMIRLASAVALAAWLSPSWLYAQSVLTVTAASADVYKSPSTGSPIIGHVARGTVLEVTRELGSWVKVSWADAGDGVGYVHVTMGAVSRRTSFESSRADASSPEPSPQRPLRANKEQPNTVEPPRLPRAVYVTPSTHAVGFGGLAGSSTIGVGASARAWRRDGWGMQLAVSRRTVSGSGTAGDVSSTAIEPGLLYALRNQVTDNWWIRPYLGSGVSFQTVPGLASGALNGASENHLGLRVFGGGELTFAGAPRFALSADLGYLWAQTGSAPVTLSGFGVALAGHWYVK